MRDEPKDVPVGGYLSSKKRAQEERALFLLARLTPAFFIETSACRIPTLHASLYSKGSCAGTQAPGAIFKMAAISAG